MYHKALRMIADTAKRHALMITEEVVSGSNPIMAAKLLFKSLV